MVLIQTNSRSRKAANLLIISMLVVGAFAIFIIPSLPLAFATTPAISHTAVANPASCNSPGCTVALTVGATTDRIALGIITFATFASFSGPTDSFGDTFVQQVCSTGSPALCIWTAVPLSTGADTITFITTGAHSAQLSAFDLTGVITSSVCTATGSGTGTAASTSTSCSGSAGNAFVFAMVSSLNFIQTAGAGYTKASSPCSQAASGFDCEFAAPSTNVVFPTNFPSTVSNGAWIVIGLELFSSGGVKLPLGTFCSHVLSCTTPSFNTTANTVMVVGGQCTNNCQNTFGGALGNPSVTDTLGNTFTLQVQVSSCPILTFCGGNTSVWSGLFTSNALVTGTDTITFKFTSAQASLGLEVYDVSGVSATPSCTNSIGSGGASSIQTSSPCVNPGGGSIAFSSLTALTNTLTAGAGFTLTTSGLVNQGTQELVNSGLASSTFFPATISAADHVSDAGMILSPTSAPTGSAVIGSCPTKNTATFAMVNNTEYLYQGIALAGESINSVSTFVSSVTSVATAQSLTFGIYTSFGTTVSALTPLTLQAQFSKSLTAGSKNTPVNWNSAFFVNVPAGATIAIAVLGTSKINLNQSSFGGLNTGATAGGVLATSLTSITPVATQLYFCGGLSYQVISTVTATTTITSFSTISQGTTTVTTTSTLTSFNQQSVVTGSVSFSILLILIMGPAILMGGVFGAIARSGVAALGGAAIGLGLGAAIGNVSGLIPLWIVGVIVLFIIALIVLAFVASDRGGGG